MDVYVIPIILGIVEGFTEFLPVSSTGHLIVLGHLLGFKSEASKVFHVVIQLGAILAVLFLYRDRFYCLFKFSNPEKSGLSGLHGIGKIFIASLPVFLLGFLLHDAIKKYLFDYLPVAAAFIAGAFIILLVELRKTNPSTNVLEDLTYKQAFVIGLFQCFSLWPGTSRSASTIVGGMLCGLSRIAAAEFSFIVAVPVMFVATFFDLFKNRNLVLESEFGAILVGFLVAFITARFSIKFLIFILGKYTLKPFAYYRILIGVIILLLLFA